MTGDEKNYYCIFCYWLFLVVDNGRTGMIHEVRPWSPLMHRADVSIEALGENGACHV